MEVNIHEAKTHLSRLLEKVQAGEEIIIARADHATEDALRALAIAMAAAALVLLLAGCVDTATKVVVKTDGSGTIEKTIILSKHLPELMQSMGSKGDAASIEAEPCS